MIKKITVLFAMTSLIILSFAGCRNTSAGSTASSNANYGNSTASGVISGTQGTTSSFLVSSAVSGV